MVSKGTPEGEIRFGSPGTGRGHESLYSDSRAYAKGARRPRNMRS